jgi:hypothetical protein
LASAIILPVAKALYLCDGYIGYSGGKTDLLNIYNAIRPTSYPHVQPTLVVYSRLSGGLGQIPFFIEVYYAQTRQLVHVSSTFVQNFPNRDVTVELGLTLPNVRFAQSGVYTVELLMDNQWHCDCTLQLL